MAWTLRYSAVFGDLAGVAPLVNETYKKEQQSGSDAMIHLLNDAAREALSIQSENAERAEAEMANRGICHQAASNRAG